jgi:tellurite resistance protein
MATDATNRIMRPEQAETFARGLYWLANVDGIDDREVEIIRAFLAEVGLPELLTQLPGSEFDATGATQALPTMFLRRVFLRAAIALIGADGRFSPEEMEAIRSVAIVFGQEEHLDGLLEEARGLSLD